MITNLLLTATLILLLGVSAVLYFMLKYNSNFLKQIQSIKGLQLETLATGDEAPLFRVHDVNGNKVIAKKIFNENNTLLLFINTNCPTCKNILEKLTNIENNYDLNVIVINNDEIFEDSEVQKLVPESVFYIRASHITTTYLIQKTPTAIIVEDGLVKVSNQVTHINSLLNMLITENPKLKSIS